MKTFIKSLWDFRALSALFKNESNTLFNYSIEDITTGNKTKVYNESDAVIQYLISTNDELSLIDLKNNTYNKPTFINHDVYIDEKEKIAVSHILCNKGEYYYLRKIKC